MEKEEVNFLAIKKKNSQGLILKKKRFLYLTFNTSCFLSFAQNLGFLKFKNRMFVHVNENIWHPEILEF